MRAKPNPFGSPNIPPPAPDIVGSKPIPAAPAPDKTKGEPTGEGVRTVPFPQGQG